MFKNFKHQPSILKKGYSQDLVQQTAGVYVQGLNASLCEMTDEKFCFPTYVLVVDTSVTCEQIF